MIPEFSHFCLILAGMLSLLTVCAPLLQRHEQGAVRLARTGVYWQSGLILLAYTGLTIAFVQNDFSVLYIAEHSSSDLPWYYRLTAVWGAHEGSMMLWLVLFAAWMFAFAKLSVKKSADIVLPTLIVLAAINIGFIGFIVLTSNPFLRTLPTVPLDGADLNPLLQDPGFLIHPPMLYMGYVGLGVCFAMAMACLWRGDLSRAWASWFRPWVTASWCFLTVGIMLGSWWAYRELGWGGWWFWDPVENAAFLPWLVATGLLHSMMVAEHRDSFKAWTLLLAVVAFGLSLLGTFLVRSGVLTSVHAFAVDPKRGVYILAFIGLIIGSGLSLFTWRLKELKQTAQFHWLSRESLLLANNVLFLVLMLTVLVGTLYPLFVDALGYGKLSVGAPYFNSVFVPLAIPVLLLMGIGPLCLWREMSLTTLLEKLQPLLIVMSVLLLLSLGLLFFHVPFGLLLGLVLASWIILTTVRQKFSMARAGVILAHLGVAVSLIGISVNSYYMDERLVKVNIGESTMLGQYEFYLDKLTKLQGPNYHGVQAHIRILKQGALYDTLYPEKRIFDKSKMPMTHAGIHIGWWGDLYVALGEPVDDTAWSLRLYRKPFVRFIWAGGIFMLLGGLFGLLQGRRRT